VIQTTDWEYGNHKLRSIRARRKCKYPKCSTVLSIYNMSKYCFRHEKQIRMEDIDDNTIQKSTKRKSC
jgi:hypothetical protein